MKKIRRRDGSIADVADGYIIQDGESFSAPISMMDSKPRMVCDSRGNPAGQRPGFLYADSDTDLAVKETLHREYCDALEQRWRSDRWSKPSGNLSTLDKSNQSVPRGTGSSASSAGSVDDAYAQYRREIEARWK